MRWVKILGRGSGLKLKGERGGLRLRFGRGLVKGWGGGGEEEWLEA